VKWENRRCVSCRGRADKQSKERGKVKREVIGKEECKRKVRNKLIGENEVNWWVKKKKNIPRLKGKYIYHRTSWGVKLGKLKFVEVVNIV
jgi:hypothetical protein